MIICLCNALRDKDVERAASEGACTPGQCFRRLGCAPVCGKCVPSLRENLRRPGDQGASPLS